MWINLTDEQKLQILEQVENLTIVQHRKTITPLRGMDYFNHVKGKLSIIPPDSIMKKWEADYKTMQENMIIGESLKWEQLLDRIKEIEERFNKSSR